MRYFGEVRCMTLLSGSIAVYCLTLHLSMPRPTCSINHTYCPIELIPLSLVNRYTTDTVLSDVFWIREVRNCNHLEVWVTIHMSPTEYYLSSAVDESSCGVSLSLLAVLFVLVSCCPIFTDTVVVFVVK